MSVGSKLKNLADRAREVMEKFQSKPKPGPLEVKRLKNRAKRRRQGR
jgi:hypothetical protein